MLGNWKISRTCLKWLKQVPHQNVKKLAVKYPIEIWNAKFCPRSWVNLNFHRYQKLLIWSNLVLAGIKWHRFRLKSSQLPIGMDASQKHLWDVSYSVSKTSQTGSICKCLRRLLGDWLKASPQRSLWDLSAFLRDFFEWHLRL